MPNSAVKPLILVVEDDPAVRNLIVAALEAHGLRHMAVETAHAAIAAASSQAPSIVLLDLGLPDMDGVKVVESVRAWSGMPIIVVSARSEDADKIRALDAGADDYLGKPFDSRELLARVRANLRRQAPIEELGVLRYGELVYDTKALLLACGREEIAVSKKLGLMIELFMKSKGQALARATLFARVWGADADVEEAILDNYIGFFRRRLAQIHSKMSLRTVRGVGYALVEEKEGR